MRKHVRSLARAKRAAVSPPAEEVLDDLRVLTLALQDIQQENERLRDARGSITLQLGPLPISAGIIAGVVAAFPGSRSGSLSQHVLIVGALVAFALMVLLSMRYSTLKPYRKLRDEFEERKECGVSPSSTVPADDVHRDAGSLAPSSPSRQPWRPSCASPQRVVDEVLGRYMASRRVASSASSSSKLREVHWYAAMIEVERDVRGRSEGPPPVRGLIWPGPISNLQQACDLEWRGLFLVKTLFVLVVALLVAARLT